MAALGLLMLAAALLAGSAVASLALRRATRGLTAAARAEWEGRRALGDVLAGWDPAADSLAVGGQVDRALTTPLVAGPTVVMRARLHRLTASVYAVTVTVRVGEPASTLAERRVRLLLARVAARDGAPARGPSPLARWSAVVFQ